jgi:glyoxylase-like metal-dependent hydrolase (beta-lactamase superfamily II)
MDIDSGSGMWLDPRICAVGGHERVYYVAGGGSGLLVDCGSDATYAENMALLRKDGVDLSLVDGLLVSHEHFDHVGAVGRAKADLGCPIISHFLAARAIETGDPLLTARKMTYLDVDVPFHQASVDVLVDEGDRILAGDLEIAVHHIPGHTPGGAAYMFEGNLIVGDTIFSDGRIGWPDIHWGSSLGDHRDSLERIRRLKPERILPGHGEAFDFDESVIDEALSKIDFFETAGVAAKHAHPAQRRSPGDVSRTIRLPLQGGSGNAFMWPSPEGPGEGR